MATVSESLLLRVGGEIGAARRMLRSLVGEVKGSARRIDRFSAISAANAAVNLGRAAFAAAQFAVNLGQGAIGPITQFERKMANVNTLLSDQSGTVIKKLQKEILKLPPTLGSSIKLVEGLYQTLSAGVEPAKAVEFVGIAAQAAKAGLTDTATAVDAITTLMNSYGDASFDAENVSDLLFETVRRGKTEFEPLARSIGLVATTAAAAGVSQTELLGSIATLTKGGIRTASAISGLRAALTNINQPSEKALKVAKALGLEFDANALSSKGLAGFMAEVAAKTKGSTKALGALFGSSEANAVVTRLLSGDMKTLTEDIAGMGVAATDNVKTSEVAFAKQQDTLGAIFDNIGADIEKTFIQAGEVVKPFLKDLGQFVLANFGTIRKGVVSTVQTITDFVVGVAPKVKAVLAEVVSVGRTLIEQGVGPAVDKAVVLLTPFFELVRTRATAAFGEFRTRAEEAITPTIDRLREFRDDAVARLLEFKTTAVTAFNEAKDAGKEAFDQFLVDNAETIKSAGELVQNVSTTAKETFQILKQFGLDTVESITGELLPKVAKGWGEIFGVVVDEVTDGVTQTGGDLATLDEALFGSLGGFEKFRIVAETFFDTIKDVIDLLTVVFDTVKNVLAQIQALIEPIVAGISEAAGTLSVVVEQLSQGNLGAAAAAVGTPSAQTTAAGGLKSAAVGAIPLLGPLLQLGLSAGGKKPPGFKDGGDATVLGSGGPDSKLAQLRVTPGEKISVTPPGGAGPSAGAGGGGNSLLEQAKKKLEKVAKTATADGISKGAVDRKVDEALGRGGKGDKKTTFFGKVFGSSLKGSIEGLVDGIGDGDVGGAIKDFGKSLGKNVLESMKEALLKSLGSKLLKSIGGIPGFAAGGLAGPGPAIVGEEGPELVNFGRTSRVFPADETSSMLGGGGITIMGDFILMLPESMATTNPEQFSRGFVRNLMTAMTGMVRNREGQLEASSVRRVS